MADETDDWDKASTIGTMVAAFLAFIALAGVVAPILVWRASRTEKHKALDLLEKGEAQNGGYITDGLRVSSSIRLFRRVRVPMFQKGPDLPGMTLSWNNNSVLVNKSSASWVQFSSAFRGYSASAELGDPLTIRAGKTWLPVHKNWIMILGLLGRFAKRPDEGKLPIQRKGRLRGTQPLPGTGFTQYERKSLYGRKQMLNLDWTRTHSGWLPKHISDNDNHRFYAIHGNIGTLWLPDNESRTEVYKTYYTQHTSDERGGLSSEPLPLMSLFWLAVGCIPGDNGDVYCLDNVEEIRIDERTTPRPASHMESSITTLNRAHFESPDPRRNLPVNGRDQEASLFIIPSNTRQIERNQQSVNKFRGRGVRAFQFNELNDRNETLSDLANALENPSQKGTIYSLDEIELPQDVVNELEETSGATYHPRLSLWTRLGKSDSRLGENSPQLHYISREAGQRLAQLLLDLKLSPEGYLERSSKESLCRQMLCNAAQALPHLLARMISAFDQLKIPNEIKESLLGLLNDLLDRCLNFKPYRSYFRTVFALDTVLEALVDPRPRVTNSIGVLMITSAEFRDIVARLARMITEASDKSITFDMGPVGMLCIPSLLGVVQKFPVDIGALYPGQTIAVEAIQVSYSQMMFAALKACLRSVFLETCLDSAPLFEAFLGMGDEVQIG